MTQLNKRTDKKYAVRKAGRRPASAQALIENKSPEWGERHALSYSVLFIALIGIVFPWKRMECQGALRGLVSWPPHCSVPPW